MTKLYMRDTTIAVGGRTFTAPLTRNFEVPFDDTKDLNTISVDIYNLTDSTIKSMKKKQPLIIQTGYRGDKGTIFDGIVDKIVTTREGVDKITKITGIDDASGNWTEKELKKTYKGPISAKVILEDLMPMLGLAIGDFALPKDHIYKSGKTVNGLISKAIMAIGKDCNAKIHINKREIYIRGKNTANGYAIEVNKNTGLIGSPTPIETEEDSPDGETKKTMNGWKVVTLLNHRISVDSAIQLKSKAVNGNFRVASGKHTESGDTYYTEMDVYPL